MNDLFDELRRDLESSTELRPACLSVDALGSLVDGTLPSDEILGARDHLATCLTCLQRYAQLRSLLEVSEDAMVTRVASITQHGGVRSAPIWASVKALWSWRLPLGWTIAASAAGIIVATLATTLALRPGFPIPVVPSSPLTPLVMPGSQAGTITGRIENIRDASDADVVAHVLRIREASGATYVLFAWGRPVARVGDTVRVEGAFIRMEDEPLTYRGLAKRYEVFGAPR